MFQHITTMQFSILKEIFGTPWQIEAGTFQRYFPLATGILKGAHFHAEEEPAENRPFMVSAFSPQNLHSVDLGDDQPCPDAEGDTETGVKSPLISIIPVRGLMLKHDMLCGPVGTRTLGNRLLEADADPNVIGHILIFETGGGTANSVPEIAGAIATCKKPVVAWVDGMMCSAGQFAGSYCREIIVSRETDLVGSIGTMTIWEGRKANSAEDNEGVIHQRIYADDASQKNEEFETAINDGNFKLTRERILNPLNFEFVSEIRKNRPGVEDKHLHGRAFPAGEVVGSLVDSIGDFNYAIQRVIALSGIRPTVETSSGENDRNKNQNQKTTHMKFTKMEALLGPDPMEFEADGRRTFTDDEMQAIEDALIIEPDQSLQTALEAERQTVAGLRDQLSQSGTENSSLNDRLSQALQENETLRLENEKLRQAPAAAPAIVAPPTESPKPGEHQERAIADKYENPMDALQEVSKEYLNREI